MSRSHRLPARVDRLFFPANPPSANSIVPELQDLAVGDRILDGPPEAECAFAVAAMEERHHLVLYSREHLPPGWAKRFGASIDPDPQRRPDTSSGTLRREREHHRVAW